MKNQIVLFIGLLAAGRAAAQTQKGNGLLSGEVTVNYQRSAVPNNGISQKLAEDLTSTVSLTAGRFWTDNWLAGVSATVYSYNRQQYLKSLPEGTSRYTNVALYITPFVRRYWQVNSVYLFAGLGLSASAAGTKQPAIDINGQVVRDGQQRTSIAISPLAEIGANYFLTNRLGFQLRAATSALPLNTANLSAGLVYWTGPDRRAGAPEGQDNPQTNTGNWVVEGGFSVISKQDKVVVNPSTATKQTTTTTSISPSIGRFFSKNNLIGLSIPFTYLSIDDNLQSENTTWSIGVSPYYQHYWTSTRLTPFTRVRVGYSRGNARARGQGVNRDIYHTDEGSGGVSVGLAYMAGQRFIIETSLVEASVTYTNYRGLNAGDFAETWQGNVSGGLSGVFAVRYVL